MHLRIHWESTEAALSGCAKAESLRTRWYVLSKPKTCGIIIEVFHFYATCCVLPFLLITFFKTVGEILQLLTLYPKLIFWGSLKKAFIVPEGRSYQTQYFTNIFRSTLASTLDIHFYLDLKESSENVLWIAIALKSAILSAPESSPETALETTILCYFSKTWLKISLIYISYIRTSKKWWLLC